MDVLNEYILGPDGFSVNFDRIGRTNRVGRLAASSYGTQRPCDIILQFNSYRDSANIFSRKGIFKVFDFNEKNKYKIFINKALTQKRSGVFYEARKLVKRRAIDSVWTCDGHSQNPNGVKDHNLHLRRP